MDAFERRHAGVGATTQDRHACHRHPLPRLQLAVSLDGNGSRGLPLEVVRDYGTWLDRPAPERKVSRDRALHRGHGDAWGRSNLPALSSEHKVGEPRDQRAARATHQAIRNSCSALAAVPPLPGEDGADELERAVSEHGFKAVEVYPPLHRLPLDAPSMIPIPARRRSRRANPYTLHAVPKFVYRLPLQDAGYGQIDQG